VGYRGLLPRLTIPNKRRLKRSVIRERSSIPEKLPGIEG
jgi:hypothetical protein